MSATQQLLLVERVVAASVDETPGSLPVDVLYNGEDTEWRRTFEIPQGLNSLTSLELMVARQYVGNLYLNVKAILIRTDQAADPLEDETGFQAIAVGTGDDKYTMLAINSGAFNALAPLSPGYTIVFVVQRKGSDALDTYEKDLLVAGLRITYESEPPVATDYDLVTLSEVKDYLKIAQTDTTRDNLLQGWISDLSSGVEGYCETVIREQAILDEIHNGDGECELWPQNNPVTALYGATDELKLGSVQYRNSPLDDWTDLVDDVRRVLIDPENGAFLELFDVAFPAGRSNIRISYYAGYDPVPGEIKHVVLEMAAMMWKESNHGGALLGVQSKSKSESGFNTNDVFKTLKSEWRGVLDGYSRQRPQTRFTR